MVDHKIKISKTAHFSVLEPKEFTSQSKVWIVFHGYGQLAKYFIQKFDVLVKEGDVVVAVEGLSRAYINGFTGRVGASWMTKEDRQDEIEDYLNYLNKVSEIIMERFGNQQFMVLGFSQGCATASRWAMSKVDLVEQLVLFCGEPAIELQDSKDFFELTLHLFLGKNDKFYNESSLKNATWIKNMKHRSNIHWFEGGHEINQKTLTNFRRNEL